MVVRRGRGLDFEHRFRTSRWAEDLLQVALNRTNQFKCLKLGLSQVAEDNRPDPGNTRFKVPDLILFQVDALVLDELEWLAGIDLTQISPESISLDARISGLLSKACCAIEVEFSPYRASKMKDRAWQKKTEEALNRRQPRKHANPPVAPNVWVKHEDLSRLTAWEQKFRIPIVVVHIFDEEAFAVPLSSISEFESRWPGEGPEAIHMQLTAGIFRKIQAYDRVDAQGAGEKKTVFIVAPSAALMVGPVSGVKVSAQIGLSASQKYVAHVLFEGGELLPSSEFLAFLSTVKEVTRL